MPTNSLLINYNDCPSSLDSLIPDNGLANLAGNLMAHGHKTQILDYSTVQTLRDFRPKNISQSLKLAFFRYKIETFLFGKMSKSTYNTFRKIDDHIQGCRDKKIKEVIKEISAKIASEKIDFIAFKLWSGEGFLGSCKIAQELKKRYQDLKIFAGGPHVEVFDKRIFSHTGVFDILCQCEGEETIVYLAEFMEGKRNLKSIPNIIYKESGGTVSTPIKFIDDLNSLADPCYDESVYPAMKGNEKIKIIMLEESRGCPYLCNFCIHKIISGNRWRLRDVNKIISTIKKLCTQLNITTFRFAGSNTPYSLRKKLAKQLISLDMRIKYIGFADTRQPEQEDYNLLKKSGCVSLFFGVESADPYLLTHIINKKSDPAWIRNSLKSAREAGILTAASIIVPCPGETKESIKKTVDLLTETKPYGVSVYPGICYPKTKWFLESKKFGFELSDNVEEKMMTYTIKFTMPPPMLSHFPFKIDGKNFYAIIDEIFKTSKQLEKRGITTTLNDSLLLMAHVLKLNPKEIKELNQKSIIIGECKKLQKKVSLFNARVKLTNRA